MVDDEGLIERFVARFPVGGVWKLGLGLNLHFFSFFDEVEGQGRLGFWIGPKIEISDNVEQ